MSTVQKPLLIFDLDETLIFASKEALNRPADFTFDQYHIYQRPYLNEFLIGLSRHYSLAIWSSAGDDYVAYVADQIKPEDLAFEFVWGYSKCTPKSDPETSRQYNLKNLKKIKRTGFSLRRMLIVDNTPAKVSANYGNAIYVQDFEGGREDLELKKLKDYLHIIKDRNDFTRVEKRFWKSLI
ncbi:MAG: HAD family hydrolase [Roseivirga sp.]|nr:HAD family hydrolase [Roseivirga sp.]